MNINWHWLKNKLIQYFIVHLFITLLSIPIIVAWGLPFSWLSPLGNFLFSPLLSLFLLFSSLAFFAHLLALPHGLLDWFLEQITACWYWLLKVAPTNSLYGFCRPPLWLLLLIAIISLASIMHPLMRTPSRRLLGLTILLGVTMTIMRASTRTFLHTEIPCNGGLVTLVHQNNQTIVIDPGCIGKRISASSWISYTLLPALISQTGSLTIDHLIILKPGILIFEALITLCDNAYIHHIYLPCMNGELEGSFKTSFAKLYALLKQQQTTITRITNKPVAITVTDQTTLSLHPDGQNSYRTITYPNITLSGCIDNKAVTFYASGKKSPLAIQLAQNSGTKK